MTFDPRNSVIDSATGLPEVPEGYFWRVTPRAFGYHMVELRKKHRFGSSKISAQPVSGSDTGPLTSENIKHSATYLLAHHHAVLVHFNALLPEDESLIGDYPPKSVN